MKKTIIILFILIGSVSFFLYAQNELKGSLNFLSDKYINVSPDSPLDALNFTSQTEALTSEGDNTLNYDANGNFYVKKSDGSKVPTWLSNNILKATKQEQKGLKSLFTREITSPWIVWLAIALPELNVIYFDAQQNYIVFDGTFKGKRNIWIVFIVEKAEDIELKSKSVNEWRFIDLVDGERNSSIVLNTRFKNEFTHENSQLKKIIEKLKDKNRVSIKILLEQEWMRKHENDPINPENPTTSLAAELECKNENTPYCVSDDFLEANPDAQFNFLIKVNDLWYKSINNDLSKAQNISKYEDSALENPLECYYRLKNYNAFLVEDKTTFRTYVNHKPFDLYTLKIAKTDTSVFHPFYFHNDALRKQKKGDELLTGITNNGTYTNANNRLIKGVIDKFILKDSSHFMVANDVSTLHFNNINSELGSYALATEAKSPDGWCFYGWNQDGIIEKEFCKLCDVIRKSSKLSEAFLNKNYKIINSGHHIGSNIWKFAAVKHNMTSNLQFDIVTFSVDTALPGGGDSKEYSIFEYLAGTSSNQDSVKTIFSKNIWDRKGVDLIFPTTDQNCDDSWHQDVMDKFLQELLAEYCNNNAYKKIKQVLPDVPYIGLRESPQYSLVLNNSSSVFPLSFKKNVQKWLYSVQMGINDNYKRYTSSNNPTNTELNKVNYDRSAWMHWLSLAYPQLKIITNGTHCQNDFQVKNPNSIRVAFLLNKPSSLWAWIGSTDSPTIPTEKPMIYKDDDLLLRNNKNSMYLENLYDYPIPDEKIFYCEHLGKSDFQIADFFQSGIKTVTVKIDSDNDALYCISSEDKISKAPQGGKRRRILFKLCSLKTSHNIWTRIKDLYDKPYFRTIFEKHIAIYTGLRHPESDIFETYWNSKNKFGLNRGANKNSNEVAVFINSNSLANRFGFRKFNVIDSWVNDKKEYLYTTYKASTPTIEDYFYSWVNDIYKIGSKDSTFWRANPIGYFDRSK